MLTRVGLFLVWLGILITWDRYRQPRFRAGDKAPDFDVALLDGRTAHLSDLHGKYTLLQFWGSWCGPCRAENPALLNIYRHYGTQGFEIFSVAIERNPESWRRAIRQDGINWPYHTMEQDDFNGRLTRMFNVKSIPTTLLLDPEGTIIGVNLAPEQIEKTLSERLAGR